MSSNVRHFARTSDRYARTRERLDASAAGHVQRRVKDLELMNQALILSALALMLFVPAVVTLAALVPIGSDNGTVADVSHRLALTDEASRDVRSLFASRQTIREATSGLSAVVSLAFAFAWPASLQRGYEIMWDLPSRGVRDMWRPLVWLVALIGLITVVGTASAITSGVAGAFVTAVICFPLVLGWAWWTQHLLLGGRVSWRALRPGAVAMSIALAGLSVFMAVFMSGSITGNYRSYGPIGVVFSLLSWFIAFSVVMLGGALVGATLFQRRYAAPSTAGR